MQQNVSGQSVTVVAIDVTTGLLKTGDAANITLYYNGDNGGVTVFSTGSGHPSEDDATNSKGTYTIAATQGESNFKRIRISGKSSTSNIQIIPYEIVTTPASFGAFVTPTGAAVNVTQWNGTNVASPATAGIPEVNVKNVNNVSTSSVATVNANIGTTQAITFNANNFQKVSLNDILATTLTETSGQLAGGFKKFFNIATPASTMDHLTLLDTVTTATTATNVTTVNGLAANVITASSIAAAALNGKGDWNTTTPPTTAAIATGVWTDTTASDFTTALSIGKSIMNGVSLGTGLTVNILTNLPSIPNNWLTAAGIAASALNGKGDWLVSSSYPTNFGSLGISIGGHISNVDTLTTYTGDTPQTGDSFARIGATGSGLTSLAPSATALSTAQWTNTLATNLGTLAGHDPGTTIGTSTLTAAQILTTALTESYNTDGAAPTLTQAVYLILQMLTEKSISSTTLTVKKLDGSTTAATFTLNDAASPTSITRTG